MIRLQDVTKVYEGGTIAVRDVNLDIQRGEFVFLVGASGSGKSTLIRLMLRQEPVTRGTVWVAGKDVTSLPNWKVPYLRRSLGTVFQDFKLLPNKTVSENVAFALEVLGRPRSVIKPQVDQVLELVGLGDKGARYPRQLSGGEQQRVSIARAFVNRPPILLADEPTGNLDPGTSVGIMKLLDRINRTGTTIVMATHDHAIVDAMQRRVVALEQGKVIQDQASGRYESVFRATTKAVPPIEDPMAKKPAGVAASGVAPVVAAPAAALPEVSPDFEPEAAQPEVGASQDAGPRDVGSQEARSQDPAPQDAVSQGAESQPVKLDLPDLETETTESGSEEPVPAVEPKPVKGKQSAGASIDSKTVKRIDAETLRGMRVEDQS